MGFIIETVQHGYYVISESSITHYDGSRVITSLGHHIRGHFTNVRNCLMIAALIKDGKTYESVEAFYHKEEMLKTAPHLTECLDALDKQLDKMTDGGYGAVVKIVESGSHNFSGHRYWGEMQDVWLILKALRTGKYDRKIGITTLGQRLSDAIMDLVWKLDNDALDKWEEMGM